MRWLLALTFAAPVTAQAATLNVRNPCTAPCTPPDYDTVQGAINAAGTDDVIVVEAGAWYEDLDITSKTLTIEGGGTGLTVLRAATSGTMVVQIADSVVTIEDLTVDGEDSNRPIRITETGSATSVLLDMVVIQHGVGYDGGGVLVVGSAELAVQDSEFIDNRADSSYDGGHIALRNAGATLHVYTSSFTGGRALNGAAISADASAVEVYDSDFDDNHIWGSGDHQAGGGVHVEDGSSLLVQGCTFSNNSAYRGGGVACRFSDCTIEDSDFEDNYAGRHGGGAYFWSEGGHGFVVSDGCTFTDNDAGNTGGGVYFGNQYVASTMSLTDAEFTYNNAVGDGGAVGARGYSGPDVGQVTLTDNSFAHNEAERGGAVWISDIDASVGRRNGFCANYAYGTGNQGGGALGIGTMAATSTWTNNAFVENHAEDHGGAVWVDNDSVVLENNTLVGNYTGSGLTSAGGTVYSWNASTTLRNNLIAWTQSGYGVVRNSGSVDLYYNLWHANATDHVGYGLTGLGATDLTGDPMLVDYVVGRGCATHVLRPAWGSPLVDAGDPTMIDPDGSVVDIGGWGGLEVPTDPDWFADMDTDSVIAMFDCDDTNPLTYPEADEICDDEDNDCDESVDEEPVDADTWYEDVDKDGFGDPTSTVEDQCVMPAGYADNDEDCDDSDADIKPTATEVCDELDVDEDCDEAADDLDTYAEGKTSWYWDGDEDGWGALGYTPESYCDAPSVNWADQEGDCHDSNDAINPGVTETWYDGVDSSCHLRSDYDQDGDTHDWEAYSGTDCVDTDALINPDMPEIWYDDLDSSCHGRSDFDQDGDEQDWDAYAGTDCLDTDEHTYTGAAWAEDGAACMTDADGDGWGDDDANPTLVDVGTDCEDGDAAIHPDAIELWYDGVDQDCDEGSDYDQDGDDQDWDAYAGTDCLDTDEHTYTGAAWAEDGAACMTDADGDGWGSDDVDPAVVVVGTDCDDSDQHTYLGADEVWYDGVDQACDGGSDYDQDGDGQDWDVYGGTDCLDTDAEAYLGADEVWYDGIDQACDGGSDFDQDGDGQDSLVEGGGDDCDDDDATTYSGAGWSEDAGRCMTDADRDGWGADEVDDPATVDVGTDCDDEDGGVNPGQEERWYDGLDEDCDEWSDYDQDGDGQDWDVYAGTDCLDTDADAYQGAAEVWYDGVDQACDGGSDYDQDGDGQDSLDEAAGDDCDDTDDETYTGAAWLEDDTACMTDADEDGWGADEVVATVAVGTDCDDGDADVNPDADEVWYDGTDQDCDEWSDYDQDGDGQDWDVYTGTDCVDTDSATYSGAAWIEDAAACMTDADEDGWGAESPAVGADPGEDCEDGDVEVNPGADEIWYDGTDQDCDGWSDYDQDRDGQDREGDGGQDCDDGESEVYYGADEWCNERDDDCDGEEDEGDALDAEPWFDDGDGDGYGDPATSLTACSQPEDHVDNSDDCDPDHGDAYPGADEWCDGYDNDCEGDIDEADALDASTWYEDDDADEYGNPAVSVEACTQPTGYVDDDQDCDDEAAEVNPDADEVCDGDDNDCDDETDEDDAIDAETWYLDDDGDDYGQTDDSTQACEEPEGYAAYPDDCDDDDWLTYPGALELCDEVDNDCDEEVDEGVVDLNWYRDADEDGYGDPTDLLVDCLRPEGYVSNDEDCDDTTGDITVAGTWYADSDGDGYGDPEVTTTACEEPADYTDDASDCDDDEGTTYPGADEWCDGEDDDCDEEIDEDDAVDVATWYQDWDDDGFGDPDSVTIDCDQPEGYEDDDEDCDDEDDQIHPDAAEVCDDVDHDCDGDPVNGLVFETWYADVDGDGFGDAGVTLVDCAQPEGYVGDATDCDDGDVDIYPGAEETWYDGTDQDCAGDDDYDQDADGYARAGDGGSDCDDLDAATHPGADEDLSPIDRDCDGYTDPTGTLEVKGCAHAPLGAGWMVFWLAALVRRRRARTGEVSAAGARAG